MINIAIDGPSGAGKSTIARKIAQKLNITYLDTGAMYRAVALYAVEKGADLAKSEEVAPLLDEIKITFVDNGSDKVICLNGRDVSKEIRRHEMSKCASDVSKLPQVRNFLVEMQRKIASENDVVLDGRDITSHVLPDAKYKFYLTATPEERARRRCAELKEKGQDVDYDKVLKDINDRDYNDTHREFAPLVKTSDSYEIDSTSIGEEEVVELILSRIKEIDAKSAEIPVKKVEKANAPAPKKKSWFIRFIAKLVKRAMRVIWITKIYFKDNFIKNSKAVVICNHYSGLDPCIIMSKLLGKNGKVVMKDEIAQNKFVANVSEELGCIPVKRGEADINAVKKILLALNKNQQVLIFPEGTRNRTQDFKTMLTFKNGVATFALKAKAPIVPLMYYKKTKFYSRNRLIVGEPFWLDQFYGQRPGDVKEEATDFIYSKMMDLRREVDLLVEKFKGSKKRYLKYKRLQSKELHENANHRSKE
ncbi:MAG: (d)CMP kinase [Clostridiales bacterium]|nr:(d)CMP kinase [Clostridiales bacterium]